MSTLELDSKHIDHVAVLYPKGLINAHTVKMFEDALQAFIDTKKFRIVVNCKGLTYVASAGLGVLMGVIDEIRSNDGDIRFAEMTPSVLNIFEILGFTHLYRVFDEEHRAVESYSQNVIT